MGVWVAAHGPSLLRQEEDASPGGGWPRLGTELRSQVAQRRRQCQELQDKLAASEATVRAQAEQLEKYHVLLREQLQGHPARRPPPRKYDSLIQAQARELSHLRQMLREGHGASRSLAQHLRDTVRSFEELLRGTDIDYYLGQGFREQLAQGRQLAERLSDKLSTSNGKGCGTRVALPLLCILMISCLHRLSRELQEKEKVIESLEAKLQERCESPGSSHPPSESSRSVTSTSFVSDGLEPCSDGDTASECSQCREEPARGAGTMGYWGLRPRERSHGLGTGTMHSARCSPSLACRSLQEWVLSLRCTP
uniref:Uncharacterized protein n=1 Tax=Apteryx owenii TaxID=8824 RepID=A0A8B9Q155_APTOW